MMQTKTPPDDPHHQLLRLAQRHAGERKEEYIMLASRITYTAIVSTVVVMNGWSLLEHVGAVSAMPTLLPSTLVLNLILVPLSVWGPYKFGQMTEEEHRRKERETAALGAAAAVRGKPAREEKDVAP
jgi:hypothetical protein